MFLSFKPFEGPSSFKFKDPDTGRLYEASSYQELYSRIRGYRSQNGLEEIPFLETVVEHFICCLPENRGLCRPIKPLKRGLIPTIRGGVSLITSLMYNSFASQEVADKRSEVCSNCPLNVFPDKGPFIKWADDVAEMSVGPRRSKFHDSLGNCAGCSCPLRSKVFYTGPIKLNPKEKKEMSEANLECWQVKESK